jgi:DNA-binding transcriptional MerR regulator
MVQDLTIEDLSKQSGLSLRTLRYYIQEGLLPGPDTVGKYASYSQGHLDHLTLIKRLKKLHLPLKEIRHLLSNMTSDDMKHIIEYQNKVSLKPLMYGDIFGQAAPGPQEESSALDYIRELEKSQNRLRFSMDASKSPAPGSITYNQPAHQNVHEPHQPYGTEGERWTKINLSKHIELNIKEDQLLNNKDKIDMLIEFAEKIFRDK